MVALNFTDEIAYKNTYPVYVFVGSAYPSAISENWVHAPSPCDNLERVCPAILSAGNFRCVVAPPPPEFMLSLF
jgi:hypothetical protein